MEQLSWSVVILQLSIWSILLPVVAGFYRIRLLDKPSRMVFTLVMIALVPQILTLVLGGQRVLNIVYNMYTLVEFANMYFLFAYSFKKPLFKYIASITVLLFGILFILLMKRYGLYQNFLNELVCMANTSYLLWIFMYILDSLLSDEKLINKQLPLFWFLTAWIVYAPCTIFVFALSGYIDHSPIPFIKNLWNIHSVFNTGLYIFLAIGLYKNRHAASGE